MSRTLGELAAVDAVQADNRAEYIRSGLKEAGVPQAVADLADMMRGDRYELALDMTEPGDRDAAGFFVQFLHEHQGKLKFFHKFKGFQQ